MHVAVLTVTLRAPFLHTLKEKRSVVKSLLAKLRNMFNVSVAEAGAQDAHQTIIIMIAALAADIAQADSIMDHILNFIESNTEAQITDIAREIR
jgi:uncharacterized protein